MSYTVRFDRGNRGWTCSVFTLDGNGLKHGPTVATGTGNTQDAAKEAALTGTSDVGIRAALSGADPSRPHWVQGALGEKQEEARKAAAFNAPGRTRVERRAAAKA